tara:strand:+ start:1426 stop:1710 length:285 start_codon:yes stop_codon:yes gene_type:complete
MEKKENEMVEIKIDQTPYDIPVQVRDLLGITTQVRDILASTIIEWKNTYLAESEEAKKELHWSELKLKDMATKLLADDEERMAKAKELEEKKDK